MSLEVARRLALSRTEVTTSDTLNSVLNNLLYPKPHPFSCGELLPHQIEHAERLKCILHKRGIAGDTSKPGTGKTYVASKIAADFHLPVLVFCPKPIMSKWYEILHMFGNSVVTVTNYDMARSSHSNQEVKWYDMRKGYTETATICPWITKSKKVKDGKDIVKFHWHLPYRCFIIFDEEHVGKNIHTQTFAFIDGAARAARIQGHPVLYASATPIEKKEQLKSIVKFLGITQKANMNCVNQFFRQQIGSVEMRDIHNYLYAFDPKNPEKSTGCMSWMPEAEIPNHITNVVQAVTYKMDEETTRKIAEHNREIMILKERLKERNYSDTLGSLNRNRRFIEMYKASMIGDRAEEMLEKGYWVPIFVNYKSTLHELHARLSKKYPVSVLHGDQKTEESKQAEIDFNNGTSRVLISTISKGGVSLSFHDTSVGGKRPRFVIVSIPTSATQLMQTIGRCFRTNVTSSVMTEIPFCDGDPVESSLRDLINSKSHEIAKFTIGKENDFDLYDSINKSVAE